MGPFEYDREPEPGPYIPDPNDFIEIDPTIPGDWNPTNDGWMDHAEA